MPNFRVRVNGKTHSAVVQRTEHFQCRVTVDGIIFTAEPVDRNGTTWRVMGNDVSRRVYVRVQGEAFELWLDGIPFSAYVAPAGPAGYQAPKSVGEDRPHGGRVWALMPGRITSVLVKETDRVEIGSPLLILEAMKMQNEIVSPVAGTVKSIHVKEGETVRKEALLVEID